MCWKLAPVPMTETSVGNTTAATAGAKASLRSRLQRRVLVPLALTWLLGSTVAAAVAYVFTQRAFDRSLLDDAYTIAAQVTEAPDGGVVLSLSPREIGAVLFDQTERVFFAVRRPDGLLVAGHAGLPVMNFDKGQLWEFGDHHYRGLDLRVVALRRSTPQPFVVVVGQTVLTRSQVLQRLLALAVVPQALLLLLLGLWLRYSISDELQPLAQLQLALESRDSSDLSPLNVPAPSRDVARLGDAANGLMARIAAGVQSQREFAGNVAHELRTPLAGIRSLAEYGLAHSEPTVWREQLQRIQQSEQRASHLVDQLLALARADEARDGLQLQALQVDMLVHELLLRTLPRADAEGVDLGAVGLEQPSWALGSVALLEGLLGNLLDNALRYGRPADSATRPRVTVEVAGVGDEVVLSVSDNGPGLGLGQGLGDAKPERVLARWMRGDAGEQHGRSAGLGLAIVARYAALLGARFALLPAADGPGLCAQVRLKAAAPGGTG